MVDGLSIRATVSKTMSQHGFAAARLAAGCPELVVVWCFHNLCDTRFCQVSDGVMGTSVLGVQ